MFGIAGAEHSDAFAVFPWDNDRVTASNQAHEVHHLSCIITRMQNKKHHILHGQTSGMKKEMY